MTGVHIYDDVRVRTHPDVYEPSDDTHLLVDVVRDLAPGRLLDVGTGTGLVAIVAARAGHRVTATDVEPTAARLARANARRTGVAVDVVRADLVRGVSLEAFDWVVCNPPYLPTGPGDHVEGPLDGALDGGPTGTDVTRRLVDLLPGEAPPLVVVTSTRQDLDGLRQACRARGWRGETVASTRSFFERLEVWRIGPAWALSDT